MEWKGRGISAKVSGIEGEVERSRSVGEWKPKWRVGEGDGMIGDRKGREIRKSETNS